MDYIIYLTLLTFVTVCLIVTFNSPLIHKFYKHKSTKGINLAVDIHAKDKSWPVIIDQISTADENSYSVTVDSRYTSYDTAAIVLRKIALLFGGVEVAKKQLFDQLDGLFDKRPMVTTDIEQNVWMGSFPLKYNNEDLTLEILRTPSRYDSALEMTFRIWTKAENGGDLLKQLFVSVHDALLHDRNAEDISPSYDVHISVKNKGFVHLGYQYHRDKESLYMDNDVIDNCIRRIENFYDKRMWYISKGLPHKLCILLHGVAGTGKTSLIRVLASYFNKDIYYIPASRLSDTDMIFPTTSEFIVVEDIDGNHVSHTRSKGHEKLMITIDDIRRHVSKYIFRLDEHERTKIQDFTNALAVDIELQKIMMNPDGVSELYKNVEITPELNYDAFWNKFIYPQVSVSDMFNETGQLSALLNSIDGLLTPSDMVIILTTNHPEHLDPALLRPGRIDMILEIPPIGEKLIRKMTMDFHPELEDIQIPENLIITPAALQSILMIPDLTKEQLEQEIISKRLL